MKTFFHQRIRELIKQNGLEQKDVAEKMGLPLSTVNTWFKPTDPGFPSVPRLFELADLLGCSIDYLAGRTDDPKVHQARKKRDAG